MSDQLSVLSTNLIKSAGESAGVEISDSAAKLLAQDVEYRIREIAEEARKFMRHSHRDILTTSDINYALRVRNVEPMYGLNSKEEMRFQPVVGQDIYYADDEELSLDDLINTPLPPVPLDVTFTGHWLAIEGVQPAIPQNPSPQEIEILKKQASNDKLLLQQDKSSANIVQNMLSKELRIYYEKLTESVVSSDKSLQQAVFDSLKQDPGIHQLVPYFVKFIIENVTKNRKNLQILWSVMKMIGSLLENTHIYMEPYLHQLMPSILTCVVTKHLGEKASEDHWALRDYAASLVALICTQFGSAYHTLQPRVSKTLLHAIMDPGKPFTTSYGAIIGLSLLGDEVIKVLILPIIKPFSARIENEIKSGSKPSKIEEAKRCQNALIKTCKKLLTQEYNDYIKAGNSSESYKKVLIDTYGYMGEPFYEMVIKSNSNE